jgi:hypothetical protein
MAEILGITSGIAGLFALAIEVYSTSAKYISGFKNASSTINGILREFNPLKNILTELGKVIEHIEFETIFQDRSLSLLAIEGSWRGTLVEVIAKWQTNSNLLQNRYSIN